MKFWILLCFYHPVHNVFGTPIFGGVDAEERKFKYQVSLREISENSEHICGGSIISNFWILTAAHCVDNNRIKKDPRRILIVTGITYLSETGDRYLAKSYAIHENWNKKKIANDIGLLETTKKMKFSLAVHPIPLGSHNPPDKTVATLTGWGFTNDLASLASTRIPNALQVAHFETISLQECRKQFNNAGYPGRKVIQSNMCIAQPKSKGQCNGDSGGALAYNGTQIGIVSFGGNCSEGLPGVMTSVATYLVWIKKKTGI